MLRVFALFHLNLAYSSIDPDQRAEVIRKCYWPLLRLPRDTGVPVGVEASGFTLELVARLDPRWIEEAVRLHHEGLCEFIGSGYAQIIGPLVPAAVNAANLRIGNSTYRRLLGFQPGLALVNEQAYSGGLVAHYLAAGYRGIVMEWDNAAMAHPDWDSELGYLPQMAEGPGGERIPLLWAHSIAFQKLQRYAHGELTLEEILDYVRIRRPAAGNRVFCVYANDAEVFDFRPGRYHTEAPFHPDGEWNRIARFFASLSREPGVQWVLPSQTLGLLDEPGAATPLRLESAAQPIPVKKQPKYNPTRWAVTGRNDLWANTTCWRVYEALRSMEDAPEEAWRQLCELWASDYRTHITPGRWRSFKARLIRAEKTWTKRAAARQEPDHGPSGSPGRGTRKSPFVRRNGRFLEVETETIRLRLNCAKGLAVDALWFKEVDEHRPLCGTLPHGYYEHMEWGADFFTGHLVFQAPGRPKITDLGPVDPDTVRRDGHTGFRAILSTRLGPVEKTLWVGGNEPIVELEYTLRWSRIPVGMLRLGHVTLNPECFDLGSLRFRTANGGWDAETFPLGQAEIDHGASVNPLVTASQCVGITGGAFEFADDFRVLRLELDKCRSALVGLVTCRKVRNTYFCRLALSAGETDETARPRQLPGGELSVSLRLIARPTAGST